MTPAAGGTRSDPVPRATWGTGALAVSGVASFALGAMGLGAVLCLLWPEVLTTPDLRAVYPMGLVRALIQAALVVAFALGLVNVVYGRRKRLGAGGLAFAVTAFLLGGAAVPVEVPVRESNFVGLDWFLLDLFVLALVFIPMERAFAHRREQRPFRRGWQTDLAHFFVSHLLVQVTVFLTMLPARTLFSWTASADWQAAIASLPFAVQVVAIVVVADLFEYGIHRTMHRVSLLWRIHAVHHSIERMDWLAASRLHLLDIVLVRAVTFIPLFVLGFANGPILAYLVFVSFHAIFIHANVGFRFGWLDQVIATPRFHHWHHAADEKAIDKNFAVHLPVIDRLFGTLHLPDGDAWPEAYGIEGHPIPENYLAHLLHPL